MCRYRFDNLLEELDHYYKEHIVISSKDIAVPIYSLFL